MEISYKGGNCVVIKTKTNTLVIDPKSADFTLSGKNENAVVLATQDSFVDKNTPNFVIDMPGEYEHSDASIVGVAVLRQGDEKVEGEDAIQPKESTLYALSTEGLRIAVIGHTVAPLDNATLEKIGMADIVIIPISEDGKETLNITDADKIIRQISPKIVIPTCLSGKPKAEDVESLAKGVNGGHDSIDTLKIKEKTLPTSLTVYSFQK